MRRIPIKLHPDEEVLGLIRRSLWSRVRKIIIALLWILVPFFFFFPLLSLGGSGFGIFIFLLGSGLIYLIRQYLIWWQTMLLITDRRLVDIDQHSISQREICELTWDHVGAVSCSRRGLWNTLFDLGTVQIKTKNEQGYDLELTGVRHPEKIRDLLDEVQYLNHYGRRKVT